MKARRGLAEHNRSILSHAAHITARDEVLPRTLFSLWADRLVGCGSVVLRVHLTDLRAVDRARVSVLLVVAKDLSPKKQIGAAFYI